MIGVDKCLGPIARVSTRMAVLVLVAALCLSAVSAAEAYNRIHYVQPGESLWIIARNYGTTVGALRRANGIWTDRIYPGQRLVIPAVGSTQNDALRWLAQLVWAEAEGEPYRGMVAVAAVILNRVAHPQFPNTIQGVIFQRGQFETVSNGRIYRPAPAVAYNAARDALNGWDPSYGAIFFFNPAKTRNPFLWSRPMTVVIGRHRFAR